MADREEAPPVIQHNPHLIHALFPVQGLRGIEVAPRPSVYPPGCTAVLPPIWPAACHTPFHEEEIMNTTTSQPTDTQGVFQVVMQVRIARNLVSGSREHALQAGESQSQAPDWRGCGFH